MRVIGTIPEPPKELQRPRGFNAAPVAGAQRVVVTTEDQLVQALRALDDAEGGRIELGATFTVNQNLMVACPNLLFVGNRFALLPGPDVTTLFEVRADWCVFDGLVVGNSDANVPTLTAFSFTSASENCVLRDCVLRASTSYSSTATRLRIFECHALTTGGGSWADLNLP